MSLIKEPSKNRLNIILAVMVTGCALALVNVQHKSRTLFIELEKAQSQTKQLELDWVQLQLDESTLGKNARIESLAREKLTMTTITADRTQYLSISDESADTAPKKAIVPLQVK
jgi:cell division protein FtsL